jgi:DNA adenine methylase
MAQLHLSNLDPSDTAPPLITRVPLLKWAGGKRQLLGSISQALPQKFNRYFEPCCGGAALFFHLQPPNAVLADANPDLIECYAMVRDRCESVIERLSGLPNTEETYYRVRDEIPPTPVERAARFIYLCTLSFNGIYRVNFKGEFNVPYGRKTHLNVCDVNAIRATSVALTAVTLIAADFEISTSSVGARDLVYFDPPYTVAHSNNGFVKYNAKLFSWQDQRRLAKTAEKLRLRGASVLVSNAEHESVRQLYPNFESLSIERASIIAASSTSRGMIKEALLVGKPDESK